ncbi:Hpt domain-containing protein [Sedimentitalea sp. HM32M-2]|uniref:Hpt domain-containing protein n=1 Tax=Sedimentitalea sp. HM32M-2 TaxID=3351566 RepID=UPI00362DD881
MIDWSRVNQLRDEVGADEFDEVVELFLEEVEDVIATLAQGPDLLQLEQNLHFLKGSALSLGFSVFSNLCQTGERLSSEGHAEAVDVAEIIQAFHASKTVFMTELPQRLAA